MGKKSKKSGKRKQRIGDLSKTEVSADVVKDVKVGKEENEMDHDTNDEESKGNKGGAVPEEGVAFVDIDDDDENDDVAVEKKDDGGRQDDDNEGNDDEEEEEGVSSEEDDDDDDDNDRENDHQTQELEPSSDLLSNISTTTPPSSLLSSDGRYHNKQRCLVLCSRGVTARYRHLLEDLRTLLPHHKKDSKLDPDPTGGVGRSVNDICDAKGCNTVLFLECRKRQDAYLWMGRTSSLSSSSGRDEVGPSVKFHVTNVHTMDELRLTGNCMKGSRPVLTFDASFDTMDHLIILKHLFVQVFGTPRGHPKSKPFVDRVMGFYYADGKIWVRNYQILENQPANAREAHLAKKQQLSTGTANTAGTTVTTSLVEIGPRFVLNPIRIFRGSFGGQTLYKNPDFVSPNETRAVSKREKGNSYSGRKMQQKRRRERESEIVVPTDPLDDVFR